MDHSALGFSSSQNGVTGDLDYAYIAQMDLPNNDSIFFNFSYAYKRHQYNSLRDSLFIEASTDCGKTFSQVWANGSVGLYTQEGNAGSFYIPQDISEFKSVSVPLSDFKGENVVFRLVSKCGRNSELYINWLEIADRSLQGIKENQMQQKQELLAFPNPSDGLITVEIPEEFINATICVYDIYGRKILSQTANSAIENINLSDFPDSIYTIRIEGSWLQTKVILVKK
ncbi:MAG: T9SS type A sorting domain-containing protein [Bacteroidales bacterium]|nr:T9SS type A sorting domain-containing protein [Bacteroidales bacterium]